MSFQFKGNIAELTAEECEEAMKGFDAIQIQDGLALVDALVEAKIASSKREAREWISQGSIQINGEKIKDNEYIVSKENALSKGKSLVKRGKRNYYVIEMI